MAIKPVQIVDYDSIIRIDVKKVKLSQIHFLKIFDGIGLKDRISRSKPLKCEEPVQMQVGNQTQGLKFIKV